MTEAAAKEYAAVCLESSEQIIFREVQKRLGPDWSFFRLGLADPKEYRCVDGTLVQWNQIDCNCHHEEGMMNKLFDQFMQTWEWHGVWRFSVCCHWPHYHNNGDVTIDGSWHFLDVIFENFQTKPFWSYTEKEDVDDRTG
jgi:hypothetical protein